MQISRPFFLTLALGLVSIIEPVSAAPLSSDHPCSALVKKYLTSVVRQDWKTAAALLLPSSLDRKQKETVSVIKTAPTMTEEAQMLERFGVKEIRDLPEDMGYAVVYECTNDGASWKKGDMLGKTEIQLVKASYNEKYQIEADQEYKNMAYF
jgi:hypothetical protein